MTDLISPESKELIRQTRSFLEETVIAVKIQSDTEQASAAVLGNELQKRRSIVEKQRKTEKSVWDQKGKEVQDAFLPLLASLDVKKELLAQAIRQYQNEKALLRIEAQAAADATADKERDQLESQASTAKEKAEKLLCAADEYEAMVQGAPESERAEITRKCNRLRQRAQYWLSKAEVKTEQARDVVTQIVEQAPTKVIGTRGRTEIDVEVQDIAAFAKWCIDTGQCAAYLSVNTQAVKAVQKPAEGRITMPGLNITLQEKVGFSGR